MPQPPSDEITLRLAEYVVGVSFDDLDDATLEATRRLLLDALAVGVGGVDAPGCREFTELSRVVGGRPEATVFGLPERLPAHVAAAVNGAMCRALDYDDVAEEALLHTTASVVPAAFAAAQIAGRVVTGEELLTAVALGIDVANRLGLASVRARGPDSGPRIVAGTFLLGAYAAACVSAHLWRLDVASTINALGIVHSQAAGNQQGTYDGAHTVRLQQGMTTGVGLFAARLAAAGVTGATRVFEGRAGYFAVHWAGRYDRSAVLDGLGDEFTVADVSIKPYPGCKFNHNAIAASLEITRDGPLRLDEIVEVRVHVPSREYFDVVCEPLEDKRRPRTSVDAQFSLPFTVASALLHGIPHPATFAEDRLRDPEVLALAQRVTPMLLPTEREVLPAPADVFVVLQGGEERHARVEVPIGHPGRPMSWGQLEHKARQVAAGAPRPMSDRQVRDLVQDAQVFETVEDVDTWIAAALHW